MSSPRPLTHPAPSSDPDPGSDAGAGRDPILEDLLARTSRTFALAIPLLPEPRDWEVTVAYLLFRIADTLEDAAPWTRWARIDALREFVEVVESGSASTAARLGHRWRNQAPTDHEGYLELLEETPRVLGALEALDPAARALIRGHTVRTARGMAAFCAMADDDGVLGLQGLEPLRTYCYAVAGIVGEMLTGLFLLDGPEIGSVEARIRRRAPFFGEALQLVNILRDSLDDRREGRLLLDDRLDREDVLRLALRDLRAASEYTLYLQDAGARTGLLAFTAVPVRLAIATLDAVRERGPGARISRAQVTAIVGKTFVDLTARRPPVPVSGWPGADRPWNDSWKPTLPEPPWEAEHRPRVDPAPEPPADG